MKSGRWESYDQAEKLYINANKVSQKVNTMVITGITARTVEYDSYLKFNNGQKLHLATSRNKASLIGKMKPVSEFFQLGIVDNTHH